MMHYTIRWMKGLMHPAVMVTYMVVLLCTYRLIDQPLAVYLHDLHLADHYPILVWITTLGMTMPYLIITPLIACYFRFIHRSKQNELRIWFLWATFLLSSGITFLLKNLLGRARPTLLFDQDLFGFFGPHLNGLYHSFPSGHTTIMTTAVLSLTLLYPRQRWIVLIIAGLILLTRVLLTYHYLSDVLATVYLVVLEYWFLVYIVSRQCPLYWVRLRLDV